VTKECSNCLCTCWSKWWIT